MREIKKSNVAKLLFSPIKKEWETLDEGQFQVTKALANPIRWWIYEELGKGAIRQAELAHRASKNLGKSITNAHLRHHLQHLERIGLVKSEVGADRVKMIHRTMDVRIQVKPRDRVEVRRGEPPKGPEDFEAELKRILRGRSSP